MIPSSAPRTPKRGRKRKPKDKTGYIPNRGHCDCGKRIYLRHEARKIAKVLSRNQSEKLVEYRCRSGYGWHVGHDIY